MSSIDISEKAGVRYLHFGSEWVQGAMRIARPFDLELEYTRAMLAPLLAHEDDWPRRALLIGLGAGSQAKFLHRHRPHAALTIVEIDARVEWIARQSFKLPDDARIAVHHADGADFVAASRDAYDLILVDGFDADGDARRLDDEAFYRHCRQRLTAGGWLATNLLSRRARTARSLDALRAAFDARALALPPCRSGNIVAIACADDAPTSTIETLTTAAQRLRERSGLDLAPLLQRLTPASDADAWRFP